MACSTGLTILDPCTDPGRLYLYDDSMYAYYPAKQLPMVDTTVEPTFANGIRFEVRSEMRCRGWPSSCRQSAEFRSDSDWDAEQCPIMASAGRRR